MATRIEVRGFPLEDTPSIACCVEMAVSRAVPFSHSHRGKNIKLSVDGLSAQRIRSYNEGIVVSSTPLEDNKLYQVEIKEIKDWKGCIKIGVTGLPPETVCSWKNASDKNNDKTGKTLVLDMKDDKPCVCIGDNKHFLPNCDLDLMSLSVGESVGVLCTPQGGIQFYLNGKIVAQLPGSVPKPRYGLVDLYGPVAEVKVIPFVQNTAVLQLGRLPVGAPNAPIECPYFQICRRILHALAVPAVYFNWSPECCKCYCPNCFPESGPKVKWKGQPPEEYAVPVGWAKFGLRVGPRAEVMDVFQRWHVCYHGTSVDSVKTILKCGGLMIRDDKTLPEHPPVPSPPNHFHDLFKPEGYNTRQIFISPSLHYCTHGEVYAGSQRCADSVLNRNYSAKVAFQLRVHPEAYRISPQTTQNVRNRIDRHIPNEKLEWSTEFRCSTILCALLIRLQDTQ